MIRAAMINGELKYIEIVGESFQWSKALKETLVSKHLRGRLTNPRILENH